MRNLFVIFFCLFSNTELLAQFKTTKSFAKDFCNEYGKATDQDDFKKKEKLMDSFTNKAESFIKKNPETLNFPFKIEEHCGLNINTSEDKNFRVYSWNLHTGNSARSYNTLFQFKSNGKVFTESTKDGYHANLYFTIHSVLLGSKTYYLLSSIEFGSNKDLYESLEAYEIINNKLKRVNNLFVYSGGQTTGVIRLYYDRMKESEKRSEEEPLIGYIPKRKILYVAIVDEEGKVSNKNIIYKIKGNKFVFSGFEQLK